MNTSVAELQSVKLPRKFVMRLALEAARRDKFNYQIATAMADVWTRASKENRDAAVGRSRRHARPGKSCPELPTVA